MILREIDICRWLRGNYVRTFVGGSVEIAPTAKLKRVRIYVYPGARLVVGENVRLADVDVSVERGELSIGEHTMVAGSRANRVSIAINNGEVRIGHHSRLSLRRVWVRFGGRLTIGNYTNVNALSEIRCDEQVEIGSYCQISYDVRIWDTNTHSLLPSQERRRVTESKFPYFGFEENRPKTAPVRIGDDCWIGERAALLKGTEIGNEVVIGFGTTLAGQHIGGGGRVVAQSPRIL